MFGRKKLITWKDKLEMFLLYKDRQAGLTMQEIAERKGIHVSNVSRSIHQVRVAMVNSGRS